MGFDDSKRKVPSCPDPLHNWLTSRDISYQIFHLSFIYFCNLWRSTFFFLVLFLSKLIYPKYSRFSLYVLTICWRIWRKNESILIYFIFRRNIFLSAFDLIHGDPAENEWLILFILFVTIKIKL
jgi:hypothetical protein